MARKTFEIAFNIAGNLAGTFRSSFSSASAQMDRLRGSSQKLKSTLRTLESSYKSGAMSADQYKAAQARVAQQLEKTKRAQERLNAAQKNQQELQQNAGAIRGEMVDTVAMSAPLVYATKSAMDFETAMLGVAKQVQGARDDSGKLTATYFQMKKEIQLLGRELPIPTNEIAAMVEAGARMNVPKQHLISFTKEVAKMATAFEMPADEIGEAMGKLSNVMNIPIQKIGQLADTINYLDDNALAKGKDIIGVMQRVGGTAKNMSPDQLAALASTFLSLGKSEEVAATATNAIIRELEIANEQPKRFQNALEKLGMSSEQINKGMVKDTQGTILKVLQAINKLPKEKQAEVTVGLFGKEYGDDVAALANSINEYKRQLGLLDDAKKKGSMDREFNARMSTSQAQMDLLKNSARETATSIGDVLLPGLNSLFQILAKVAQKASELAQEYPNVTKALVMGSTALIAAKLGWLGVRFGINSVKLAAAGVNTVFAKGVANAAAKSATKTANSAKAVASGTVPKPTGGSSAPKQKTPSTSSKPAGGTGTKAAGKAASKLATAGKVLGKAALPLTVAAEAYNIAKSNDKTKATAQAAGGIAGGLAGAKMGAVIGTAIAPGIGTAIGGFLGGLGGYIAGKWTAGKATDAARAASQTQAGPTAPGEPGALNTAAVNQQMAALVGQIQIATGNFSGLTMYAGQASGQLVGAIFPLVSNIRMSSQNFTSLTMYIGQMTGQFVGAMLPLIGAANTAKGNMNILTSYIGQASGWVASINGIQTGATAVKNALNNLAQRISSVQVSGPAPTGGGGRVKAYARGTIVNHPHMGLVGEAGRESIIPWKQNTRSYSLWEKTGKGLGFMDRANALGSGVGSTLQFTYAPVYQGANKAEIEPMVKQDSANLLDKLRAITNQKERVSFG